MIIERTYQPRVNSYSYITNLLFPVSLAESQRCELSSFMSDVLQEKIKKNKWKHIVIQRKCMIPALVKKPRKKYEVLTWNYNLERSLFEESIL